MADESSLEDDLSRNDFDDIESSIPAAKVSLHGSENGDVNKKDASTVDKELMPPPPPQGSSTHDENDTDKRDKKLETPLGAMLPSKYADVDVTEIFPDFRQDKVLRFSRLFGYGKFSSLPQIWRSVRRKKKKKEREQKTTQSESASDSDEPRKCNGFSPRFALIPPKEEMMSDDEEKLLSDKKPEENEQQSDNASANNAKLKEAAEWRFGPAKLW